MWKLPRLCVKMDQNRPWISRKQTENGRKSIKIALVLENEWVFVHASTSNCKIIGHFSIQNHHFSEAILHSFCIFSRRIRKTLAFVLQLAVPSLGETIGAPGRRTYGPYETRHICMKSIMASMNPIKFNACHSVRSIHRAKQQVYKSVRKQERSLAF